MRASDPRGPGGRTVVAVRGTLRLVAWCLALAATLTVLHRWRVPGPAVDLASREPADLLPLVLVGGRWVALACAWYLAGVTALTALASLVAWRPLRRLDAAVTLPAVRRLVRAGLGATLALGVGLGPSAAAVAAPGPPGASARPAPPVEEVELELPEPRAVDDPRDVPAGAPVDDGPAGPADDRSADEVDAPTPRPPEVAPPEPHPRTVAPPGARSAPPATAVERAAAEPSSPTARTHEVVAGESFWSIAADLTAAELGRAPEDAEVFERWVELIEANRDQLVIPDDPDLLLPGQRLRLPGGNR